MDAWMEFDGSFLLWIQENIRTDLLTAVFRFITRFGDKGLFWIGVCAVLILLPEWRETGRRASMSLALNFLLVNLLLKNLVARIRPYERIEGLLVLTERPGDFSFPSGHTAASFAVAAAVFMSGHRKAGGIALVFAALIGISRLYLGVHYPTDVLGGAAAGIFSAWIIRRLSEYRQNKKEEGTV